MASLKRLKNKGTSILEFKVFIDHIFCIYWSEHLNDFNKTIEVLIVKGRLGKQVGGFQIKSSRECLGLVFRTSNCVHVMETNLGAIRMHKLSGNGVVRRLDGRATVRSTACLQSASNNPAGAFEIPC